MGSAVLRVGAGGRHGRFPRGGGVQRASLPNPPSKKIDQVLGGGSFGPSPPQGPFLFAPSHWKLIQSLRRRRENSNLGKSPSGVGTGGRSPARVFLGHSPGGGVHNPHSPLQITDQVLGLEKDARVRVRFYIECRCIGHPRQPPPSQKRGNCTQLYTTGRPLL